MPRWTRAALAAAALAAVAALAAADVEGSGGSGRQSSGLRAARSVPRAGVGPRGEVLPPVANAVDASEVPGLTVPPTASRVKEGFDGTNAVNTARWWFAGDWANGGIFNNGFRKLSNGGIWKHKNGWMVLRIIKWPFRNPTTAGTGVQGGLYPHSGAEMRTQDVNFGYGCYSICVRPTRTSGIVSSFYLYSNGVWDSPWASQNISVPHREIDIEWLVRDGKVVMQSNVFNDPPKNHPNNGFEEVHEIPWDASRKWGSFSFKWKPDRIIWWVGEKRVRTLIDGPNSRIPKATDQTMRWMMNSYSVTPQNGGAEWAGTVPSDFRLDSQRIKWVHYTPYKHCRTKRKCGFDK